MCFECRYFIVLIKFQFLSIKMIVMLCMFNISSHLFKYLLFVLHIYIYFVVLLQYINYRYILKIFLLNKTYICHRASVYLVLRVSARWLK